ncbi:hypothetical protein NDU88_008326 [Pleurodeles waltl]|uniref:Uncharacterized protein n=1 Tax=Pleurodeles waltl TaxID=8319 RepID=A0AAV7NW85_PLEWA|nr:hypothetical protein NDU88_008326 [Pleurodeles waltl]
MPGGSGRRQHPRSPDSRDRTSGNPPAATATVGASGRRAEGELVKELGRRRASNGIALANDPANDPETIGAAEVKTAQDVERTCVDLRNTNTLISPPKKRA